MFGFNPIRKYEAETTTGFELQVHKIFPTIQGEGPFSGLPAVFLRLTGCHLACTFCDTTWDDVNDPVQHVDDITTQLYDAWSKFAPRVAGRSPLFVVTGGEPLRQNLSQLIFNIGRRDKNARIQIETAGSFWQHCLAHDSVHIVVSPKTPTVNFDIKRKAAAFKYVIRDSDTFSEADGLPMSSTQRGIMTGRQLARPDPTMPPENIYLSPCDEGDLLTNARNMKRCAKLSMDFGYRVGLQVHKAIGVD